MKTIDPYGSELIKNYEKIIKNFGLEKFDKTNFPNPNLLMKRNLVFASRDSKIIADCIKNKKPFYVLSGIMPTNDKIHLGTKHVVEQIRYFQDNGAKAYILIADLESLAARNVSLEEAKKRALNFHIPAYIALGLDPKKTIFYFQSENKEVMNFAYKAAQKITLNEFKAVYGNADPGRIMSAVTQIADILFPQFEKRIPGIIPVGIDQDPHIRLTRDIVSRIKSEKFITPSSIYHQFTPSLDGSIKMSKSKPESCIELPEEINIVKKKIKKALTGGRDTLEEHRRLGADLSKDMVYELLKMHLIKDDNELKKIHDNYISGKLTSGEIKELACKKMEIFMNDFNFKLEKAKKEVNKVIFVK